MEATKEYVRAKEAGNTKGMEDARQKAQDARAGKIYSGSSVTSKSIADDLNAVLNSKHVTQGAKNNLKKSEMSLIVTPQRNPEARLEQRNALDDINNARKASNIFSPQGVNTPVPKIAMVLGSVTTSGSGTTILYRAVSPAEFNELMNTGKFSPGSNGLNAKFFAETYENAVKWGDALEGQGNYKVIKIQVSNKAANGPNKFIRWEKLDGIGAARAAECSDLNELNLEVMEINDDDDDDDDLKPGGGTGSGGLGAGQTKTISDGQGFNYIVDNAGNIRRKTSYPDSWMQPMWLQPPAFVKITDRNDYGDVFYNLSGYRRGSGQNGIPVIPINPSGGIPIPAPAPVPIPVMP